MIWCFVKKLCRRRDARVDTLSWWSCQSPGAHSCILCIIWIVSVEECSSLMQDLIQICCSNCSVILNVTATQYTCSLNGVYHPHWLVQWSHHCSCMHIPVPSPWLPGYIDVTKTILIILTMVELFPDRLHKYNRMDCFHLFGLLMTFPIAIWTFFQTLPSHRAVVFYPLNREKFTVRFAFYIGGVTSSVKAVLRNISYCLFSIHIPVHW